MTKVQSLLPSDDLLVCLRPVLVLGQLTGSFPFGGVFRIQKEAVPVFRFPSCIPALLVLLFHCVHSAFSLTIAVRHTVGLDGTPKTQYSFQKMDSIYRHCVLDLMLVGRSIFILRNRRKFIELFHIWRGITSKLWSEKVDSDLRRNIYLSLVVILATIYLDNTVNLIRHINTASGIHPLNALYNAECDPLPVIIPYAPATAVLCAVYERLSTHIVTLSSALVVGVAMAMNSKFRALVEFMKDKRNELRWKHAREDYLALCVLMDRVNECLSYFIFFEMVILLYFISVLTYTAVTPNEKSVVTGVYAILALAHLVTRFLLFCLPAGGIREASEQMWMLVQQCPKDEYNDEVNRLERLVAHPIGFTCMGLFTITRAFPLKFFNVVFTFAIVLLQATSNQK